MRRPTGLGWRSGSFASSGARLPTFPCFWARSTTRPRASSSGAVRPSKFSARVRSRSVGARACSTYGSQVARVLARDLAAAGVVVVSGMARGVDGEAHRGALEAGGITVAVLGCGIDRDYPAVHAQLAREICERGLVVSEYAPGVEPAPWRFPARNRIIAGLASAVVVVEARERSGALITADLALEEGRDVFAVPGEITSSLSTGSNGLLRLGAHVLTSADDVHRRARNCAAATDPRARARPKTASCLRGAEGSARERRRARPRTRLAGRRRRPGAHSPRACRPDRGG